MKHVIITGGTGLIGTRVTAFLQNKGYAVTILTRHLPKGSATTAYALWDTEKGTIDPEAIAKADHIIHLAGAGVADARWTTKRKQEILLSRTRSSELLVKALQQIPNRVQSVISASAIGWYGPDTDHSKEDGFLESTPAYPDYLGNTCQAWESAISGVQALQKRLVILRTGIVLSDKGGALPEFLRPLCAGIATIMGTGKQVVSWIHIDDLCRIYLHTMEQTSVSGIYNAVSPYPVTNKELVVSLAEQVKGRWYLPVHVPAWILKAVLGEMSIEVLKSATVNADAIQSTGFLFAYPHLKNAINDLLHR